MNTRQFLIKTNEGNLSPSLVLEELETKFGEAMACSSEPKGSKNLIYFTVSHDKKYLLLLDLLLNSLWKNSKFQDFEILIITTADFREPIQQMTAYSKFIIHMMFVEPPADGVESSMNKLRIFEFPLVNRYKRILFLDADIIILNNMDHLFNQDLDTDKIYSSIHRKFINLHNTVYHSLVAYTPDKLALFKANDIHAFNAGQFLFCNTDRMRKHFENIIWLKNNWPGKYFFEQAFMNHYFNHFLLSDIHTLFSAVKFVMVLNDKEAVDLSETSFTFAHFIGHACNFEGKYAFLKKHYKYLLNE